MKILSYLVSFAYTIISTTNYILSVLKLNEKGQGARRDRCSCSDTCFHLLHPCPSLWTRAGRHIISVRMPSNRRSEVRQVRLWLSLLYQTAWDDQLKHMYFDLKHYGGFISWSFGSFAFVGVHHSGKDVTETIVHMATGLQKSLGPWKSLWGML